MSFLDRQDLGAHSRNSASDRAIRRSPAYLAQGIRNWLDSPDQDSGALTASMGGTRALAAEIMRVFPAAREVLGESVVLAAAVSREKEGYCCTWMRALQHARAHGLPEVKFKSDLVPILGQPCNLCKTNWMNELRAKVAAARYSDTLIAAGSFARVRHTWSGSGGVMSFSVRQERMDRLHSIKSCAVCEVVRDSGLTASAVPLHSASHVVARPMREALITAWQAKRLARQGQTQ